MGDNGSFLSNLGLSERVWHLRRTTLASGLDSDDLELVCSLLKDEIIPKGQIIYEAGAKASALHFLNRGAVRISMKHVDGREKTVRILRGGEIFGIEAVAAEPFYQAQAIAHEETWLSILSRERFLDLVATRPALSLNLVQILLERLREARDEIRALCFMDIEQRLIMTLLKLCRHHGLRLAQRDNWVKLRLKLSHDYLARLTGSNRPYLSNIMSDFKKRGWIQYRHKHLLVDYEALSRLAQRSSS
jgi:CRP-like cAMP-binding protein